MSARAYLRRLRESRRGTALAALGLLGIAQGSQRLLAYPPSGNPVQVPHEAIPDPLLGLAWVLAGLWALRCATRTTGHDASGFMAIATLPFVFAASYVVSWLTWLATDGDLGSRLGILEGIVWGLFAFVIAICAAWPDVKRRAGANPGGREEEVS